jgi:hypothetical protein
MRLPDGRPNWRLIATAAVCGLRFGSGCWAIGSASGIARSPPEIGVSVRASPIGFLGGLENDADLPFCNPLGDGVQLSAVGALGIDVLGLVDESNSKSYHAQIEQSETDGPGPPEFQNVSVEDCQLTGEYYPGTGANVFFACATNDSSTLLLTYNASEARVTGRLPIPSPPSGLAPYWRLLQFAYEPSTSERFVAPAPSERMGIDVLTDSVVSVWHAPGLIWTNEPLLFDPSIGAVIYIDENNSTIRALNPDTGAVLATGASTGAVVSESFDPVSGQLLLVSSVRASVGPGNCTVIVLLNATTLHEEDELSSTPNLSESPYRFAAVDPTRGVLFFATYDAIWAVTVNPLRWVLDFQDPNGEGALSLVPISDDDLDVQGAEGDSPTFQWLNATVSSQPQAPFSATPIVGALVPAVLGRAAGALVGVIGLRRKVDRARAGRRGPWEP